MTAFVRRARRALAAAFRQQDGPVRYERFLLPPGLPGIGACLYVPVPVEREEAPPMNTPAPLTIADMTGAVQHAVNAWLAGIADDPQDGAFEMTAPATGQRFRVTVTEVPGWSEQMDRELAQVAGTEQKR